MGYFLKQLAHLAIVGALLPAAARAQTLGPVRGLHIQQAPTLPAPGPRITLDAPPHKGPLAVIYVDGQRRDSTALLGLHPDDIATVSVVKADVARRLGPEEARRGVLVITTKAGEHAHAVRAFDKRLHKLGQASLPAPATGSK